MDLVIVESPAKAKSIHKYLGGDVKVLASYGHVRDLLSKDGSVRPDDDFAMSWEVDSKANKRLSEISSTLKTCDRLILATDPDREGEAISWHVLDVLRQKGALKGKKIARVVFNAITPKAVLEAMKNPRDLDQDLVDAYLARRALDYLVGFTLSPVLWRKLPGSRSAGRVQSVALRVVCEREKEIEAFKARDYWTLRAQCVSPRQEEFEARLSQIDGKKLDKFHFADDASAQAVVSTLEGASLTVLSLEQKPVTRSPYPPFTTSTLQQEASRKLGFSSKKTMQIAQKLYEGFDVDGELAGLITYMRTDSVHLAPETLPILRKWIEKHYGKEYLPSSPRQYKTKSKNAQEAHEAIRPTDLGRTPEKVRRVLDRDHAALYELIWKRTVASQMEVARFERMTVDLSSRGTDGHDYTFRAVGSYQTFDGFLVLYQEGRDDDTAQEDDDDKKLPLLKQGESVSLSSLAALQHTTEPPPRYTEASLIKKMEEIGIGRPSTYTSILSVLHDRGYVRQENKKLVPEGKGRIVTTFLESFFARYVEYGFTASLEEQLDSISRGECAWKAVLKAFWTEFSAAIEGVQDLRVTEVLDQLNTELAARIFPLDEQGEPILVCPLCQEGTLSLKLGKFGAFVGCSQYPTCGYTRPMKGDETEDGGQDAASAIPSGGKALGSDPETGDQITLFNGRFGPYVQRGEMQKKVKPPRCGIPKGVHLGDVDLDLALKLLSLPRVVGAHPETGDPIEVGLGRYGPFVRHGKVYANLATFEDLFTIGLNHAVSLLADQAEKKSRGGRQGRGILKELGVYEGTKEPIVAMTGRYGPYLKCGKKNIKIPKDLDVQTLTLEEAQDLVRAALK